MTLLEQQHFPQNIVVEVGPIRITPGVRCRKKSKGNALMASAVAYSPSPDNFGVFVYKGCIVMPILNRKIK